MKALIGRKRKKNWNDERRATGRSYRLMVSSKQTEKRNRVLGERERQMLKELFVALIERIVELTENLVHEVCSLLLPPATGLSL